MRRSPRERFIKQDHLSAISSLTLRPGCAGACPRGIRRDLTWRGTRAALRGFTLLELMVVLVLVGIIFSFAVLSLGGDELAEAMERETGRLATLLGMASDEAVMRGEELAIHFSEDSYAFLVLRDGEWLPAQEDTLLKSYILPPGVRLRLEVEGEPLLSAEPEDEIEEEDGETRLVPQVYILSSGEMTPFVAVFDAEQSRFRYHLSASLLGEIEWEVEESF